MQTVNRVGFVIAMLRGVDLVGGGRIKLRCNSCGDEWSPVPNRGARKPVGGWICRHGCNDPRSNRGSALSTALARS
jgi:hypothetical protein